MKFSLSIPVGDITPDEFQTMPAIREMASALEQASVDACFVTDHPAPGAEWLHTAGLGHDALDPFAALSFIASASEHLLLQTNIVVLPYRNPFITAKAATTVQQLSGGRLIMGVAPGYQKPEFEALGVDFHKRGVLTDEALDTIRQIWAGGKIIKQGRGFHAQGNEQRPSPDPAPPIWVGGASDKAIQRAARAGDGWCPFFSDLRMSEVNQKNAVRSIEHLRECLDQINELRAQHGRTGRFDIQLGPRTGPGFSKRDKAQQYVDEVGQLEEAGVTWVSIEVPHSSRAAYLDNVAWYAEEVISRFS